MSRSGAVDCEPSQLRDDALEVRVKERVRDIRIHHSENEPQGVQVWDDEAIR